MGLAEEERPGLPERSLTARPQPSAGSVMSSDSSKKRKPKVIRTDGGPQEGKRGKADGEQVKRGREWCVLNGAGSEPTLRTSETELPLSLLTP